MKRFLNLRTWTIVSVPDTCLSPQGLLKREDQVQTSKCWCGEIYTYYKFDSMDIERAVVCVDLSSVEEYLESFGKRRPVPPHVYLTIPNGMSNNQLANLIVKLMAL